ncbi:hypothetical protein [Trinickia dinghuensis]|uniref:Uncharacterized protein n=1 Tax=Trinickia dinghuensis TaxID=2291023 RepID=A0A3D8JST8_9BURK|nr:hypothetical protein [Trinickia dinghuensis]RDU96127.1 hypothetical protein DWV00_26210 [Trinickia dinghuensis]
MSITRRQRQQLQDNAAHGFLADVVGSPDRFTMRQLSTEAPREGTVRQTVGSGTRALWNSGGLDIPDANRGAAAQRIMDHLREAAGVANGTTYAAALFDENDRPTHMVVMPNRVFGDHTRPPTESHDARAGTGDHRGHAVSQAQTMFAPGVHRALMTSQSPEMNTAVQLSWEREVNGLIAQDRQVIWEVHNEYSGLTGVGMLPRASHQWFVISSVNARGEDLRVHVNASVSQR